MWYMYRRLALAIVIVWLKFETAVFQIIISASLSLVVIGYLITVHPMRNKRHNMLAIYNEIFVYVGCLLMVVFTEYTVDPEMRYELGYTFLYWIAFALLTVNFTMLFYDVFSSVFRTTKQKISFRKQRRQRALDKLIEDQNKATKLALKQTTSTLAQVVQYSQQEGGDKLLKAPEG